jgi:hypothetical protein
VDITLPFTATERLPTESDRNATWPVTRLINRFRRVVSKIWVSSSRAYLAVITCIGRTHTHGGIHAHDTQSQWVGSSPSVPNPSSLCLDPHLVVVPHNNLQGFDPHQQVAVGLLGQKCEQKNTAAGR